ncbi:ERF family protein [uncultured Streptococcus sp.]|uniref:ERF family protein n=1 Tax=uncultured Streptococcus sp. TaxID=83427 RepID=UPI0028D5A350|nr:ERF family protein [uncultured Streptococcus sp.]
MEEMTFTELQQRMQLEKKQERNAKYASRSAEDIYNTFKGLKSNWSVVVDYDLVVVMDKTYIKATATAFSKEKNVESVAFAELSPVPILKTRNGDLKQMTEPQWTGAVQSYAGKYALQSLFAIGDQDVDQFEMSEDGLQKNQTHNPQPHQNQQPQAQPQQQPQNNQQPNFISNEQHDLIMQQLNELALLSGRDFDTVGNYYLQKYKLNNFHELLVPGLEIVVNDIQGEINKRRGN